MVQVTTFYMDDSGTRHPDRPGQQACHGNDWFALGGILIDEEDKAEAEGQIDSFRARWPQMGDAPLHSAEIRASSDNFKWLGPNGSPLKDAFCSDLNSLLCALPVTGLACVIDRPGYNARYTERYGRERWSLCRTAFTIAVERAVKLTKQRDRKLRVYVEVSSKADDAKLKEYYKALKETGHCFNSATAARYNPIPVDDYRATLYDFKTKMKTSRLTQIADLYLWPICMAGYDKKNRPYNNLRKAGRLIEYRLSETEAEILGTKYSCFESVTRT